MKTYIIIVGMSENSLLNFCKRMVSERQIFKKYKNKNTLLSFKQKRFVVYILNVIFVCRLKTYIY